MGFLQLRFSNMNYKCIDLRQTDFFSSDWHKASFVVRMGVNSCLHYLVYLFVLFSSLINGYSIFFIIL